MSRRLDFRQALGKVRPQSRTAWFAAYVAGLDLILFGLKYLLRWLGVARAAASVDGWAAGLSFVLFALLLFLAFRWFRRIILWRLRNRLIITYLFIGGVPVVLLVLMAGVAAYFISGQFATFLTTSEIQAQLEELEAAGSASADQLMRSNKPVTQSEIKADDPAFPGRAILVLPQGSYPKWLKEGFKGMVVDRNQLWLRAASLRKVNGADVAVVSTLPVDQQFLSRVAAGLGPITLYVPVKDESRKTNVSVSTNSRVQMNGKPGQGISAGTLPERQFHGDRILHYYAFMQPVAWENGEAVQSTVMLMTGSVRLSTLYARLSTSISEWANIVRIALTALAGTFGVIVFVALVIGIRLTRTMTRSVANLYKATEHINRGDFGHRIEVKERDQLGELQVAFNSMTASLEKLIAEQKEKERLQSELEIAQEVQAQLFPKAISGGSTLELYGICRPARIVSGDYYDFLTYGPDQVGIAVGDISGKGISAALLMATIHSAVRAYEQDPLLAVAAAAAPPLAASSGSMALALRHAPLQSPSQILWMLNRQLYRTTQPEKYATMFLSFYDGHTRRLTYSNAGHLPPLILSEDGSLRSLDVGGTVVGLFDDAEYEEGTVQLYPKDIFIAFSDGITEPENEFGEFGQERLLETVRAHRHLPLERIADQVIAAIQDWIGHSEPPDDITLVLARTQPGRGSLILD